MPPLPADYAAGSLARGRRRMIRVLVVDDSITARSAVCRILEPEPDIRTVATAGSGEVALEVVAGHSVDMIILDLEMPGMGGLAALPKLLEAAPDAQILVVSSLTARGAQITVDALAMGAADTLEKPRSGHFDDAYRESFLKTIRALCEATPDADQMPDRPERPRQTGVRRTEAIALGASTGGIHALTTLFQALPSDVAAPIFVTQHLPSTFMAVFTRQLANASGREAIIVEHGMAVVPGRIHVAPGDANLIVGKSGDEVRIGLTYERSASHCLPSVDPMFESLAHLYGSALITAVLTGMGRDGLAGSRVVSAHGGTVLAQNADSCAVFGMPRAVIEAGLAREWMTPADMGGRIGELCSAPAWT